MKFFEIIPQNTNINFIDKFKYFLAFSIISGILVVWGIAKGGLNYGIDFTGGTVVQVKYTAPTPIESVRGTLDKLGEKDAAVASLGKENLEYLITIRSLSNHQNTAGLDKRLVQEVGPDRVTIQSVDVVGPKVGKELKWAALISLIYTVALIMVYIWFRFDFRFAPGATIAMVHDLLLATGFYLLTGREFTITAIAALLTIAGYSVNDTIVVYDRVREIMKKSGNALPLSEAINRAVNITLSRTVLTSLITLVSIIPIVLLTSGELQSFAIAMCVGIFIGCYSTIYIASPFTIYVEKYFGKRVSKKV